MDQPQNPQAYPLHWPPGAPITPIDKRGSAQFRTSLGGALKNVKESLRLFGADTGKAVANAVVSSNVALGHNTPADGGIAVWFIWANEWRCIPVDRYKKPEHNLQAVHHIIEARRTEFRHGGLHIAKAAFSGFTPMLEAHSNRHWSAVLGVAAGASHAVIKGAYRQAAKHLHADKGGDDNAMAELNAAYEQAKSEKGFN